MKKIAKILSLILAVILTLSCVGPFASAAGESNLTIMAYDGFAVVMSCLATATGEIDIPATYNGAAVTQISNNAFNNCTRITKVTVPASVTKIGNSAFYNCDRLEEITFAGTNCTFGTDVFYNCRSLSKITLPSKTKQIPAGMFYDCQSLENFEISSSIISIGKEAFGKCSALKSVTIPASTTSIGENAFIGCNSVAAYTVASGNVNYSSSNGVLYGPDPSTREKALLQYPNSKTQSTYTVLSDTKIIADYAFGDNGYLTKIVLPDGLETIDDYAFYSCKKLSDITIPSTVTYLGSQSFGRCEALKSITIPSSVTNFESAFYMSALESVVFEEGIKEIGIKSFEKCGNLTSVAFPSSMNKIGNGAFFDCTALGEVVVPATVTVIERGAFENCDNITLWVDNGSVAHTYAVDNDIRHKINGVDNKTVKYISVLTLPDKTSYIYKESIDTRGLELFVAYSDGSSETVTSGYEVTPKVMSKTGSQVIDVTYEGCKTQFGVSVSYTWWQWIINILLLGFLWY